MYKGTFRSSVRLTEKRKRNCLEPSAIQTLKSMLFHYSFQKSIKAKRNPQLFLNLLLSLWKDKYPLGVLFGIQCVQILIQKR